MKKLLALTLAMTTLSACHYLGEPEQYTVVDEERAPVVETEVVPVQPVVRPMPQPIVQPMPQPVVQPMPQPIANGSACQINPGVRGPIQITIPEQTICIP